MVDGACEYPVLFQLTQLQGQHALRSLGDPAFELTVARVFDLKLTQNEWLPLARNDSQSGCYRAIDTAHRQGMIPSRPLGRIGTSMCLLVGVNRVEDDHSIICVLPRRCGMITHHRLRTS